MTRELSAFQVERLGHSTTSVANSIRSDGGRRSLIVKDGAESDASWCEVWFSAVVNCTNTIIGAGTLAVPAAMSMTGLVVYHIIALVVFVVTFISLRWLVAVTEALPSNVPRNYETVAEHFLGPWAATVIGVAFIFGGFALTMGYMLLITTSLSDSFEHSWNAVLSPYLWTITCESAWYFVLFGIGLAIVLPLGLLRDISKLKFTSAFAILAMMYSATYVLFAGQSHIRTEGVAGSVVYANLSSEVFEGLAIMVSAFSCHISVMPIYESLGKHRSLGTMLSIVWVALLLSFVFYEVVGLAGYLAFGSDVEGNVLESFSRFPGEGRTFLTLAKVGVSSTLIFSVPIILWPLRSCIISGYQKLVLRANTTGEPTTVQWTVTTSTIMIMVLAASVVLPDVKIALGFVGSIGGSFVVFVYPAAFYLKVVKRAPYRQFLQGDHAVQVAMIGAGIVLGVVGLMCLMLKALRTDPSEERCPSNR